MMKRSLARRTAFVAALIMLGGVAAGTAQAAEAPACAKEQLAYLDAEDKAAAADNNAAEARAKLDRANKDQKKLTETSVTLNRVEDALRGLFNPVLDNGMKWTEADYKDYRTVHDAATAVFNQSDASNAVGVADLADKAIAPTERILSKVPKNRRGFPGFMKAQSWLDELKVNAVDARKATTAKDRTILTQKVSTATTDSRTAHDAVAPARADLKTCLKKATA